MTNIQTYSTIEIVKGGKQSRPKRGVKKMNIEILNITALQMGAFVNEGADRITIMGINNPAVMTATYKDNKLTVTYYSHAVKEHILYTGITVEPEKVICDLMGLLL